MGHQLQKNIYSEILHKTESPKTKLTAQYHKRNFERVGWWWRVFVSHSPPYCHPTPDTQTEMSQYHRYDLNVRGGMVVVGSIKIGKKIYRFKTES